MTNEANPADLPPPAGGGQVERSVRHQRGDELPMLVTVQGAVRVNAATVVRDYGDCVLVHVDLHSKRAVLDCVGGSDDGGPCIYLVADEHTLHLNNSQPRDAATVVEFHELRGWRVFCADGPGRYTVAVTLLAPDA
jgi:hypothetical protein